MNEPTHKSLFVVSLREGELIPWSSATVARMLLGRVYVGGRRMPRRTVWRRIAQLSRAWFDWWAAWPGDRFYAVQRDVHIEVRKPGVTAGYVSGQFFAAYGEAVFAMAPDEPCRERWWEVSRVR